MGALPALTRVGNEELLAGSKELARREPVFAALHRAAGPCVVRARQPSHFEALARSIVFQQLAGAAASSIYGRFRALVPGRLDAESVLALSPEMLRSAGLSGTKAASIVDLAQKVKDGTLPLTRIGRLPDEKVIERLVTVRGIGRWTAEMFLIFQLRRPDVWPVGDYGVRKGYALAFGLPALPTPVELNALGERFRPYRSVAAWYCWRAVDTTTPG